ncbi:MAG: 5-(carboxyamino)imidazole ribonucleotide mutase [Candidatus Eisenbacteria bacterium]|nr:5-(carboxyamino)imidazole ribonucleotide mutase [Candidatus Eisenbacteria bacterium]
MTENTRPKVAVLMGSDSDLKTMVETQKTLATLGIPHVTRITSAHRTPERTAEIARGLEADGVEVVVVGAGLAAHLAGVIASFTTLPVIGVPMEGGPLSGVDALYATVQMPAGIPVATLAIGKHGARNAGVLAAEILGIKYPEIKERLEDYRSRMRSSVEEKDRQLAAGSEAAAEGD